MRAEKQRGLLVDDLWPGKQWNPDSSHISEKTLSRRACRGPRSRSTYNISKGSSRRTDRATHVRHQRCIQVPRRRAHTHCYIHVFILVMCSLLFYECKQWVCPYSILPICIQLVLHWYYIYHTAIFYCSCICFSILHRKLIKYIHRQVSTKRQKMFLLFLFLILFGWISFNQESAGKISPLIQFQTTVIDHKKGNYSFAAYSVHLIQLHA